MLTNQIYLENLEDHDVKYLEIKAIEEYGCIYNKQKQNERYIWSQAIEYIRGLYVALDFAKLDLLVVGHKTFQI